jgi:hypothetical protein
MESLTILALDEKQSSWTDYRIVRMHILILLDILKFWTINGKKTEFEIKNLKSKKTKNNALNVQSSKIKKGHLDERP